MTLFKNKMRSAHGVFSSKRPTDPARTSNTTINSAKMGSSTELAPAYVDSVMAPDTDAHPNVTNGSGGAFNEPLVLDFATMQDASNSNTRSAPLSPVTRPADPERRESWLSDDDTAPAPQIDFTRKDIHIPSRTRYVSPFGCLLLLLIPNQFQHSSGQSKAHNIAKTTERRAIFT
jgi:hypothetical protein